MKPSGISWLSAMAMVEENKGHEVRSSFPKYRLTGWSSPILAAVCICRPRPLLGRFEVLSYNATQAAFGHMRSEVRP